jgi:predicted PurR-regulated permease PerM
METTPSRVWSSRRQIRVLTLTALTLAGLYLCALMILPFVSSLAWALALAAVFLPAHRWVERRVRRPNLAASLSVAAIVLLVAVPATFVAERITAQALAGAGTIAERVESGEWERALEGYPRIAALVTRVSRQVDLPGIIDAITTWMTNAAAAAVAGSVRQAVGLMLTFYLLYYLLRDRALALTTLRAFSPLSDADTDRLVDRVDDTIHATVYGTLAMAVVQGTLGGLMFWWLGLPAPVLWGVVMGLLAVVPVLGAFVIWVPAALLLALNGEWGKALVLTLWGGVVVAGIDNVLYPIMVGNRLRMHTIPAFIAVVGGLIVFGTSGVILGPVTLTVTMLLLEVWRSRTASHARNGSSDSSEPDSLFSPQSETS